VKSFLDTYNLLVALKMQLTEGQGQQKLIDSPLTSTEGPRFPVPTAVAILGKFDSQRKSSKCAYIEAYGYASQNIYLSVEGKLHARSPQIK
jgi:hypothetical protein